MFLVYDKGVVVVDAPPSYSAHLKQAIADVTDRPITHLIYSHAHIDHIGGAAYLGGTPSSSLRRKHDACSFEQMIRSGPCPRSRSRIDTR
ncbi:MBL fold metallo-hydrolase [Bradyrhizobium sp. NAS80.1]|uniref:MBL fold metallo-hydrolase n=1 Tax=Bradyrhizobium sp. NAS80.1 TaxID=1680159 RepID=UPI001FD9919B|nr:MBL fold metallo-hydrolase [Bradyrhizobium sp. NAS80.1]